MIGLTTNEDIELLKSQAIRMLQNDNHLGLVILINELRVTNFKLPLEFDIDRALRWCCRFGYSKIWEYLVSQNLPMEHNNYYYALSVAINYKHTEIIKSVVKIGCNNSTLYKLSICAARHNRLSILKYLLSQGAVVDFTTLKIASIAGSFRVVKYLIETVNIHFKDTDWIKEIQPRHIRTIKYLNDITK